MLENQAKSSKGLHVFLSMWYRKPPKTKIFSVTSAKLVPWVFLLRNVQKQYVPSLNFPETCLCNIDTMYKHACSNIKVALK